MNPKTKDTPLPEPGSFDDFWNDNERIVENTDDENEPTIGYWIEERKAEHERLLEEFGHEREQFEL